MVLALTACLLSTAERAEADILQIGATHPAMFFGEGTSIKKNSSSVSLKSEVLLEGYSAMLSFYYLFLNVDSISRKFRFVTSDQETIKLSYNTFSAGLLFRGNYMMGGIAYGLGDVELICTSVCNSEFTDSEKTPGVALSGFLGIYFLPYASFYGEMKYYSFEKTRLYSKTDSASYYEFTDTSGLMIGVGILVDF